MKHDRRVELIELAVEKLIEDNRKNGSDSECNIDFLQSSDDDAEYQLALSQLLSASQVPSYHYATCVDFYASKEPI